MSQHKRADVKEGDVTFIFGNDVAWDFAVNYFGKDACHDG
jgi:hypothetical protein